MKAHLTAGLLMAALTMAPSLQAQDSSGVSIAGSYNLYGPRSIAVQDNYAFVGAYGDFTILDISDPADIGLTGQWSGANCTYDVALLGDLAFLADLRAGLRVIDISDLEHPQLLASIAAGDYTYAYSVVPTGDYTYLANYLANDAFLVIDTSDPARPEIVATINPGESCLGLAVSGDYAFVAGSGFFAVVDISNPLQPSQVASVEIPYQGRRVTIQGDRAYLTEDYSERQNDDSYIYRSNLRIYDISNPERPSLLGVFGELDQLIWDVAVSGNFAYLAATSHLRVVNVSDPENPVEVGWYRTSTDSRGVAVVEPFAYVAQSGGGLFIYDCSNAIGQPDLLIADENRAHDFGGVVIGLTDTWPFAAQNIGHFKLTLAGMEVNDNAFILRNSLSQWRWQEGFPAGPAASDQRLNGVEFVGDRFYVTGGDDGDMTPRVYVFNREGELVDEFNQFAESAWGMRDLAWDGDLLWGADGRTVFGFTTAGELTAQFEGPLETTRSSAWDPARELLWLCDLTSPIFGVDREGNVVVELEPPGVRTYGAAWYPEDPDGFNLYLLTWTPDHPVSLHKVNVETGELREVRSDLEARIGERSGGGLAITDLLNPTGWDLVALLDGAQDAVEAWQITDFYRGEEILVPADEQAEMVVGFAPAEARDYEGALTIRSDDPEEPEIVIQLTGSGRENRAPEWANLPEAVEADEGELVKFTVSGSDPDGSPLTIKLERPDLPYAARLEDQGDGSALLSWQTDFNDEGEYTARFSLSDGVDGVDAEVAIKVIHVVSAPDVANTPLEYRLYAPRPNPFNAAVTLRFDLPQAVQATLRIYTLNGVEVLQLADGVTAPGSHQFIWDASDYPGGLYIARLTTPLGVRTAKLALVR